MSNTKIKEGYLFIDTEVNENLPPVTDNLAVHYPLDGSEKGIGDNNIYDYSVWKDYPLTGNASPWNTYGGIGERSYEIDPFGKEILLWKSGLTSSTTYPSEGGIYSPTLVIDPTKTYRVSWWEKRVTNNGATYGRYYAGMFAYGATNGAYYRTSGNLATNLYFWSADESQAVLTTYDWFLIVGHIWPAGSGVGSNHSDSGIYNKHGEKINNINYDFVWHADTTSARSRTLAIYRGDVADMEHHTCYPRFEVCDGTEPTLQDLISGEGLVINGVTTNSNNTLDKYGLHVETATDNLLVTGNATLSGVNWSSDTLSTNQGTDLVDIDGRTDVRRCFIHQEGGESSYGDFRLYDFMDTVAGDEYVVSFEYKYETEEPSGTARVSSVYKDGWKLPDSTNTATITELRRQPLGDGWTRYEGKLVINTGGRSAIHLHFESNNGDDQLFYIDNLQVEKKEYATAYVNGTRADSGGFGIVNPVTTGDFAINFWVKINSNYDDTQSYQAIFSMGSYYTNNSFTIMDDGSPQIDGQQRLIRKSDDGTWGWLSQDLTTPSNFREWNMITVVRNSVDYICYSNGEYVGSIAHGSTTMGDTIWVGSCQHGTNRASSVIKDLSIYNNYLTADEVKAIYAAKISVTPEYMRTIETMEMDGWKHVWGGAIDTWYDDTDLNLIDTDNYGDTTEYDFNEIVIVPRNFKRIASHAHSYSTVPETCRLKESWRYYTKALSADPDTAGRVLTFHSLADGLEDVEIDSQNLGYCYGNSWRRYGYIWYVNASGSFYIGQYESQIGVELDGWGPDYADKYATRTMMRDITLLDSNLGMTPLESQMVDVFIRRTTEPSADTILKDDTYKIKNILVEEATI